MDEDISIINTNTRNERIKNFFINNRKRLIIILVLAVLILISFFGYGEYKKNKKIDISNLYNLTIIEFSENTKVKSIETLIKIINEKDPTYSLLSLYYLLDNNLIKDRSRINDLFDVLIEKTSLDEEIRNLVVYKKGLFNADKSNETELLNILDPLIKSDSVWKSHALYLMAEFFYSKNEKLKSQEFFNEIINLENSNPDIFQEAQKRLNRDFSD
tara:strand:- start:1802 stop:2446 length:645 start_codon:yes stop_codon:yes gene_type:complete